MPHRSTPRHRRRTALAAMAMAAVPALSACSSEAEALEADAPLPTEVPAGTTLVVADQQSRVTAALGVEPAHAV